MLVLLRFHPEKEVGEFHIEKINRIVQWKEEDSSHNNVKRRRKARHGRSTIVFGGNPNPSKDPYDDVLDAILDYGKLLCKLKEEEANRVGGG